MKKIIIDIHKFGPLQEVSFQVAPFMVFTGMSKLGKSYANYLVYYLFTSLLNYKDAARLGEHLVGENSSGSFTLSGDFLSTYLHDNVRAFMCTLLGDPTIECDVDFLFPEFGEPLRVEYQEVAATEEDIEKRLGNTLNISINGKEASINIIRNTALTVGGYSQTVLSHKLLENYYYRTLIFPPANGALINTDYSLTSSINPEGMYGRFLLDNDYCTSIWSTDEQSPYLKQIKKITDGDVVKEEGKEFLVLDEGKHVNMSAAASSIKEISPLLFLLKNRPILKVAICLEEPEAHLHPSMQIQVADLIAECINNGFLFHITTHSDYFMDRLNQLIKLGNIRKKNETTFKEYCTANGLSEKTFLDGNNVKAYFFHRDDETGKVVIEELPVEEGGIPMKTFYETVEKMRKQDEQIDEMLYSLNASDQ
ncbi:AAA family ATPase [Prevotella denticola]|uniref:AAA family ATPase n=1 Tax=Prevotella denticola TaxID=28129 RepID=UPI00020136A3|nr:AAA family ATPase [Prevotella denticola]AEA20648.1 hypothetical protein HMPREF9137_0751 [Prevotella denticola F0289]QUB88390.1 AAA family ATPase [Prevotella denticola]QUI94109.1 AAA family ATPase [Prevotella denticola]